MNTKKKKIKKEKRKREKRKNNRRNIVGSGFDVGLELGFRFKVNCEFGLGFGLDFDAHGKNLGREGKTTTPTPFPVSG